MRKPNKAGRLSGPEVQQYAQLMNNYGRTQWARAGYPTKNDAARKFVTRRRLHEAELLLY